LALAAALDRANGQYLAHSKSPSAQVHALDNRGSHFYLALYWAKELAALDQRPALKAKFANLAQQLQTQESTIVAELNAAQGQPVDLGGYYHPDTTKAQQAMRPSPSLNQAIAAMASLS
jgi:isocitrate dehydrogenase